MIWQITMFLWQSQKIISPDDTVVPSVGVSTLCNILTVTKLPSSAFVGCPHCWRNLWLYINYRVKIYMYCFHLIYIFYTTAGRVCFYNFLINLFCSVIHLLPSASAIYFTLDLFCVPAFSYMSIAFPFVIWSRSWLIFWMPG